MAVSTGAALSASGSSARCPCTRNITSCAGSAAACAAGRRFEPGLVPRATLPVATATRTFFAPRRTVKRVPRAVTMRFCAYTEKGRSGSWTTSKAASPRNSRTRRSPAPMCTAIRLSVFRCTLEPSARRSSRCPPTAVAYRRSATGSPETDKKRSPIKPMARAPRVARANAGARKRRGRARVRARAARTSISPHSAAWRCKISPCWGFCPSQRRSAARSASQSPPRSS